MAEIKKKEYNSISADYPHHLASKINDEVDKGWELVKLYEATPDNGVVGYNKFTYTFYAMLSRDIKEANNAER